MDLKINTLYFNSLGCFKVGVRDAYFCWDLNFYFKHLIFLVEINEIDFHLKEHNNR